MYNIVIMLLCGLYYAVGDICWMLGGIVVLDLWICFIAYAVGSWDFKNKVVLAVVNVYFALKRMDFWLHKKNISF